MEKIHKLAAKTGLSAGETRKMAKFGVSAAVLGLAALALGFLAGCFKGNKPDTKPDQPSARTQPGNLRELAASVNTSTSAAKPKDCGMYPGYPCGTKYCTVSAGDFNGRQ